MVTGVLFFVIVATSFRVRSAVAVLRRDMHAMGVAGSSVITVDVVVNAA